MQKGFYAYSSRPTFIKDVVEDAVKEINAGGTCQLMTWRDMTVTGKFIINEIITDINSCDFFCADLTGMNDNVLFEIGYAIGIGKPIWLSLDTTHTESKRRFNELNFFTDIGYCQHTNSNNIISGFLRDKPFEYTEGALQSLISEHQTATKEAAMLFLKSHIDTNYSQQIIKKANTFNLPLIIDDPAETKIQTLNWYVENIFKAPSILAQLSAQSRTGHELHNSKCAFLSGLALGFDKELLMVSEEPYNVPIDFKGYLKTYFDKNSCKEAITPFMSNLKTKIAELLFKSQTVVARQKERSKLQKISFGEYIAEHESKQLHDYYIETAHLDRLVKNENNIIIGRKGAGKTATLYYLKEEFSSDKRNHVCLIKPINFEFDGLVSLIENSGNEFESGYLIESIWKFLILTELARSTYLKLKEKPNHALSKDERSFISFVNSKDDFFVSDLSTRLEEQLENLLTIETTLSQKEFKHKISEKLHDGIIREMLKHLAKVFHKKNKVILLIDNLDKSWKRNEKLKVLSKYVLGILGVSGRVIRDLNYYLAEKAKVTFHLTLFLRSDIFKYVQSVAREPDKIEFQRISWTDPSLFFKIIEQRFVELNQEEVDTGDLWEKYVTKTVEGVDVKSYIISKIYQRPRDIIYVFQRAKDLAVQRGHAIIEESDIIDSIKDYSSWVFTSVIVENGVTQEQMEDFMYNLMGEPQVITKDRIVELMKSSSINSDNKEEIDYFIDHLVNLSVIGREIKKEVFDYDFDFSENKKNQILAKKLNSNRFRIHDSLAPYLECE